MKDWFISLLQRVANATIPPDIHQNNQLQQRSLYFYYRDKLLKGDKLPDWRDTGFRVFSQSDEDGLLLYIFSLIGFSNRLLLDVASGSPYGGNSTNLIVNWGFNGLLVENNNKLINRTVSFYSRHPDAQLYPPKTRRAWITVENINQIIAEEGVSGEIDLFSLDVDGIDYWLWKGLEVISPRVVVVEYQDMFFAEESVTVPYKPDFNRFAVHPDFFGASLAAFAKLANIKGYRLVGCNRYGYNAFFIRNDLAQNILPEVSVDSCLVHPKILEGCINKRSNAAHLLWEVV